MKILVTGANGTLGNELTTALDTEGHVVTATDIDSLDICNLDQTIKSVNEYKPELIINCAGYTSVDNCEIDIDKAYNVNAIGPKNLAIVSNQFDIPLLHISSDYIFDGNTDKPYREDDSPNPQNVYGKSKLQGEEYIKNNTSRYFILRTQWLYGKHGDNFVKTIISQAKKNKVLTVVNDQFGSPTYAKDLVSVIYELIKTQLYGIYHVTNSGICSWYAFAKLIMELIEDGGEIKPCTTEEFPRPAKRPRYSVLENYNLRMRLNINPLRHYEEVLQEYLNETRSERQP